MLVIFVLKGGQMEITGITKQIIDFQKASFDCALSGAITLQEYSENVMDGFLSKFPWMNEESIKTINTSRQMLKTSTEEYKKIVHQGFAELEKFVR